MVDIGAQAFGTNHPSADAGGLRCDVHTGREMALALTDAIRSDTLYSGYQHPAFLKPWIANSPHQPVFLVFRPNASGPVVLPLERTRSGVLTYPGERQANGNFPIGRASDLAALALAGESAILRAVRNLPLEADAIILERQLPALNKIANPFVFENSFASPNPALALSLDGGFNEVLKRHSAKRRRKRFRGQERRLAGTGGYRYVPRAEPDRVAATLNRFFALKAAWFARAGIADVFSDNHVKAFYHSIFERGAATEPATHELKYLEVGGDPIAIIGCTVHRGRLTVEFGSYDETWSELGPGDMLFFLAIREAAERGLEFFDFGIGDEFYKRGWCEIETLHSDTIIPLTLKGQALGASKAIRNGLIRSVKNNKTIWQTVKELRRRLPIAR
ncbi:GNAT family N-acetyltransferase [Oricola cellulosilytica]|nr:GNAT family N-acetyltransferase [Oricola cellulosilytica]